MRIYDSWNENNKTYTILSQWFSVIFVSMVYLVVILRKSHKLNNALCANNVCAQVERNLIDGNFDQDTFRLRYVYLIILYLSAKAIFRLSWYKLLIS